MIDVAEDLGDVSTLGDPAAQSVFLMGDLFKQEEVKERRYVSKRFFVWKNK